MTIRELAAAVAQTIANKFDTDTFEFTANMVSDTIFHEMKEYAAYIKEYNHLDLVEVTFECFNNLYDLQLVGEGDLKWKATKKLKTKLFGIYMPAEVNEAGKTPILDDEGNECGYTFVGGTRPQPKLNTSCSTEIDFVQVGLMNVAPVSFDNDINTILAYIFFVENHNDVAWYRSLSVGDVVFDMENYKAYMCVGRGWKEVPEVLERIREIELAE
jgi:hypothetical protein